MITLKYKFQTDSSEDYVSNRSSDV